jgi:hypothetical protein
MKERTASTSHGESWGGRAHLFQLRQGTRIGNGIATHTDGAIITAEFPFVANSRGDPPNCRMVEEKRLDKHLQDVDEVVVSTDVRQLMGDQRFELLRRQTRHNSDRQENHGAEPTDDRRHFRKRRLQNTNRTADARARRQV